MEDINFQRAMGWCDMAVEFSGKSPLNSPAEEVRILKEAVFCVSRDGRTSVIVSLIQCSFRTAERERLL